MNIGTQYMLEFKPDFKRPMPEIIFRILQDFQSQTITCDVYQFFDLDNPLRKRTPETIEFGRVFVNGVSKFLNTLIYDHQFLASGLMRNLLKGAVAGQAEETMARFLNVSPRLVLQPKNTRAKDGKPLDYYVLKAPRDDKYVDFESSSEGGGGAGPLEMYKKRRT
jgi:hypothetical protein